MGGKGKNAKATKKPSVKGNKVLSEMVAGAAALGAAVAREQIAKTKKKKREKEHDSLHVGRVSSTVNSAPSTMGVTLRRNHKTKHTPFIVTGSFLGPQFGTDASALPVVTFPGTSAINLQIFNIDIVGNSNTVMNPAFFPLHVRTVAYSFEKWRIRRLVFKWVPLQSTGFAGQMMFGVDPVTSVAATTITASDVVSSTVSLVTPVWQPCTLDATPALNRDWLYITKTAVTTDADSRQEQSGSMRWTAKLPGAAGASANYGYIMCDFEIELANFASTTGQAAIMPSLQGDANPSVMSPQDDLNFPASMAGPSSVRAPPDVSRDVSSSLPSQEEKEPNQAKLVDGRWFIPAAFNKQVASPQ